ncbi:MAG: hypothetical protein U9N00_01705, partial [Candidatus Bipolaricaulota bacterium]|nr:hypothetical protein [Candidatus Bipolaricaulota bacterium]
MSTSCTAREVSPILTGMNPEKATIWIAERLHDHYGEISVTTSDPLEELILTILSQNTNDTNRDRAYASLLSHFGDLDKVRQALVDE